MQYRIAYYFQSCHYVGVDWGTRQDADEAILFSPRPEGCFRCLLHIKPKE